MTTVDPTQTKAELAELMTDAKEHLLASDALKVLGEIRSQLVARHHRRLGHAKQFLKASVLVAYERGVDDMLSAVAEMIHQGQKE